MLGDKDEESVFDRLWEMIGGGRIRERFGFMIPLWIIRRPETLTILDYRPTFLMFMTAVGFAALAILFVLFFFFQSFNTILKLQDFFLQLNILGF